MTNSLLKIINSPNRVLRGLSVTLILATLSFIPLLKTFGKLNIGSDTFLPPSPENSYKMTYEWLDRNNGEYVANDYRVWISILHAFKFVGLDIYQTAFVYQFLIFFLSGLGLYKIYNLVNKKNPYFGLIPAIFYIYSPHLLDHQIYFQSAVGIVWVTYVAIKFIVSRKLNLVDAMIVGPSLGIISDLPNPKYHFLLFLLFLFIGLFGLLLKLINFKDIKSNLKYFLCILLMSTYLLLPFLYFSNSFLKSQKTEINVKLEYKETGVALDYRAAFINKMVRLFHTPNISSEEFELISKPYFYLTHFSIPILVLGLFPFILLRLEERKKKIYILFYCLALFFIFLAKGSNPPFGFIYDLILNATNLLVFMRTTAGIVIYAAIFYALILGMTFEYLVSYTKFRILAIVFMAAILSLIGHPYWTGEYFRNRSPVNPYLSRKEFGLKIPNDYFESAKFLQNIKLDSKIDIYPKAVNYQNNNWGYFGFLIYPWLLDKPMIAFDKTTLEGKVNSSTNAMYIYHDKSLEANYSKEEFWQKPKKIIFASKVIDIYEKNEEDFVPHFYVPISIIQVNRISEDLLKRKMQERIAIYDTDVPSDDLQKTSPENRVKPYVEYKKITPAKYRIRIHRANGPFPLLFSENFHEDWKLYLQNVQTNLSRDKFIAKDFKGTTQNDNLPNGPWYETINLPQLTATHLKADGFANSWIIDTEKLCNNLDKNACIKKPDGTFDFELIAEFWPQKLANISWFISTFTFLFCSLIIVIKLAWQKLF